MANQAAKKRKAENEKILSRLRWTIIIANLIYLALRMGFYWSNFGFFHWVGFILTSVAYYFCHSWIASIATPTFDEQTGELLDGGGDLNMKGNISEYCFDIVYICAFVQVVSILTDWVWLVMLVIPTYALIQLYPLVIKPWLFGSGEEEPSGPESKADRKKREKMERKQNKVKYRTARR